MFLPVTDVFGSFKYSPGSLLIPGQWEQEMFVVRGTEAVGGSVAVKKSWLWRAL